MWLPLLTSVLLGELEGGVGRRADFEPAAAAASDDAARLVADSCRGRRAELEPAMLSPLFAVMGEEIGVADAAAAVAAAVGMASMRGRTGASRGPAAGAPTPPEEEETAVAAEDNEVGGVGRRGSGAAAGEAATEMLC